jgi:hypothetical protein
MKKAREVIARAVCDFMNRPLTRLGRADRQRRLDEADFTLQALGQAGFAIVPSHLLTNAMTEAISRAAEAGGDRWCGVASDEPAIHALQTYIHTANLKDT